MTTALNTDTAEYESLLLERAACWPGFHSLSELTDPALRRLTREQGIDFATALLYDRIRRSPEHGPFIARVEAGPGSPREPISAAGGGRPAPWRIAAVPGAFYREHRHTGADGGVLLEEVRRRGYAADVIPVPSFGRPADAAALICDWLRRQDGPLVLMSLCKGAAEVKLALARPEAADAFRRVVAWVTLSGVLRGTPLIDWMLRRPLRRLSVRLWFWWRGYAVGGINDLARRPGALLDDAVRLPAGLRAIHVVGFPLARHLSCPLARRGRRRLAGLGPNDGGGVLLADVASLPGLIYPVWAADHYLRPPGGVGALVRRILAYLEEETTPCPAATSR